MASMLLRVILPADQEVRMRKIAQIPSPRGANGKEWAMIVEVDEAFVWHQPINGGTWLLDCRAIPDDLAKAEKIEARG